MDSSLKAPTAASNEMTLLKVKRTRPHFKLLAIAYTAYQKRATRSGRTSRCRIGNYNEESTSHIVSMYQYYELI